MTQLPVLQDADTSEEPLPRCPFYGMSGMFGTFIPTEGNQCGLVADSHSPCRMEMSNLLVDWDKCTSFHHEKNISLLNSIAIAGRVRDFATGRPLSYREWYKRVMGKELE